MRKYGGQIEDAGKARLNFTYAQNDPAKFKVDRIEDMGGRNAMSAADLQASQMSDLSSYRPGEFKRKYEKELHLMIDDLEMPNDDMTISSFSQSAWQGKSTRSFLSNLTSHRGPANDEMSASANENQLTGGTRTISRQDLNNFNGSYSSSQEFEMGETRNNNIGGKTFKSQEEGRGSPAFARDQISVTDDLTLSQTNEEGKSSYRGTGVGIININDQSKSHTDREYATLGDHGHS